MAVRWVSCCEMFGCLPSFACLSSRTHNLSPHSSLHSEKSSRGRRSTGHSSVRSLSLFSHSDRSHDDESRVELRGTVNRITGMSARTTPVRDVRHDMVLVLLLLGNKRLRETEPNRALCVLLFLLLMWFPMLFH